MEGVKPGRLCAGGSAGAKQVRALSLPPRFLNAEDYSLDFCCLISW